jgi:hypothetical protein
MNGATHRGAPDASHFQFASITILLGCVIASAALTAKIIANHDHIFLHGVIARTSRTTVGARDESQSRVSARTATPIFRPVTVQSTVGPMKTATDRATVTDRRSNRGFVVQRNSITTSNTINS